MRVRVALGLLAIIVTSAASAEEEPTKLPPIVPMVSPKHPSQPRILDRKPLDIPQSAKDEGHNGRATYWVGISPDGKLDGIQLFESSGSDAIDDATMNAIIAATFSYGTRKDGTPSFDQIKIWMEYARWDNDSVGGGLDDYRCADLTKEYDWFTKANGKNKIFALQNFYVSRDMLANVENVDRSDRKAVEKQRAKYTKEWLGLIKTCRKAPDALLLDKVKDPKTFRMWVESF